MSAPIPVHAVKTKGSRRAATKTRPVARGTPLPTEMVEFVRTAIFDCYRHPDPVLQGRLERALGECDWHGVIAAGMRWHDFRRQQLLDVLTTAAKNAGDRNQLAFALLQAWPRIINALSPHTRQVEVGQFIAIGLMPLSQADVDQLFGLPDEHARVRGELGRFLAVEGYAPSPDVLERHLAWRRAKVLPPFEARIQDPAIELMRARAVERDLRAARPERQDTFAPMGGL